jgi:hypothetical protein
LSHWTFRIRVLWALVASFRFFIEELAIRAYPLLLENVRVFIKDSKKLICLEFIDYEVLILWEGRYDILVSPRFILVPLLDNFLHLIRPVSITISNQHLVAVLKQRNRVSLFIIEKENFDGF